MKPSDKRSPPQIWKSGDRLADKYVLGIELGRGGMGTVFEAHDETLGRDVAVKLLHARGLSADRLFKGMRREARALAALDHPNIVRVIEAGVTTGGAPYLVMELVPGKTLRELSEHLGPIDVESTISFGIQIGNALISAHEKEIVHCDLKPDNVLVTRVGRIKITDFGLARHAERGRLGTTDQIVEGCGTPHYMAPELFLGRAPSPGSDIYAMGATLIELLTGKHMFAVDSVDVPSRAEVKRLHLNAEPAPIEDFCGPLVAPLGNLVRSMISKDPRERPTAHEVVAGLKYEYHRLRRHADERAANRRDGVEDDDEAYGGGPVVPAVPASALLAVRKPTGFSATGLHLAEAMQMPPVSARVAAYVTEEIPDGFVARDALPVGFGGGATSRSSAPPRAAAGSVAAVPSRGALPAATEKTGALAVHGGAASHRSVTEKMPARPAGEATPEGRARSLTVKMRPEDHARAVSGGRGAPPGRAAATEPLVEELRGDRRTRGVAGSRDVAGSGEPVTVTGDPETKTGARAKSDGEPRAVRVRPITLIAVGAVLLSVGLLARDVVREIVAARGDAATVRGESATSATSTQTPTSAVIAAEVGPPASATASVSTAPSGSASGVAPAGSVTSASRAAPAAITSSASSAVPAVSGAAPKTSATSSKSIGAAPKTSAGPATGAKKSGAADSPVMPKSTSLLPFGKDGE